MTASGRRTMLAARNASASASSDTSDRRRSEPGAQRRGGGALSSIQTRLAVWLSSLEGPRKLAINGLIVVVSVLGSSVVLKDALKQVAVIDTISVPKDLEADGYTPATMAQRIIDAVTQINRDADTTRRIGIYTLSEVDPLEPESADYESPGRGHSWDSTSAFTLTSDEPLKKYDVSVGGVSLTTVILHLRKLFGVSDTRISGEITVDHSPAVGLSSKDEKSPPKKFSIRLRISDKGHVQYEAEATDKLETLVQQAALKLVERFDPLDAAYYSYYKRDYDNALRIVRAYLADPTKKETHWARNLLGLIEHGRYNYDKTHAEMGYDRAIAVFTELKASDSKFAPALYNLSSVLIDKGQKHLKDPDSKVALALFSQALEVALEGIDIDAAANRTDRERAVGFATAGQALRLLGRWQSAKYDEALSYFERSIKSDAMFIYPYLIQGEIHNERKEPTKAIGRYQLATEINPSAQTFTRAGTFLRKHKLHTDAATMFQKAVNLKPSANAYTYWGMALRDSEQHEEARDRFQKAIETDPNSPNGYNQLGRMYLKEGKLDEAADNFKRAINASPQWSNYHYNLGVALRRAGKLEQAITAFEKATALYQSHAWSYAELGATLAELDLQQKGTVAVETARKVDEKLKKAIEIAPGDGIVLRTAGKAYDEFLKWPEQALEAYRRAIGSDRAEPSELEADIERLDQALGKF